MASSEYCKLDDEIASNLLSYYVVGNEAAATQLTLTLHVHNREQEAIALSRFLDAATLLYRSALQTVLPNDVKEAIITRKNLDLTAGTKLISMRRDKWKGHRVGGYSFCFYIKRCS